MKALIELVRTEEGRDFLEEVKNLNQKGDFVIAYYNDKNIVEIYLNGDFYIETSTKHLWIEDSDFVYYRIPQHLIKRIVFKGE